tara:strand:+ start:3391 stop:4506 length:1116 start_codon:yes stop_codon:yes gene_type:complete
MSSPEEHHELGPSTLKYVEICPGYRSSNETNQFAEEGTMLHSAAETGKLDGLNDEQVRCVRTVLDYVKKLEKGADEIHKEMRVKIVYRSDGSSIFGTVDLVIIVGTHAYIVDYKFGWGEVDDADINIQIQAYAKGVFDKFPDLETAKTVLLLPRRDELLEAEYTRKDMIDVGMRLDLIITKAEEETPDLRPNTEGCRFCKHRLSCQALSDKLLPIARKYEDSVDDFQTVLWHNYDPAHIEDPKVIGKMLNVASVLDRWASAAKKQALKLAEEEGREIPGYDLRWRTPSTKIEDAQEAYDTLAHLLTPEEFMEASNVTLAQLSKALAKKLPRGEKKNARGTIEIALEEAGLLAPEEDRERAPYLKKAKAKTL